MQKLLIRRDVIEKLLARFKAIFSESGVIKSERDGVIIDWFDQFLSDDSDPISVLVSKVGRLRPGWDRPLTAMEMHTLSGSSECLREFTDTEWSLMRDFLAHQQRAGERYYQVRSRDRFLQAPVDTLGAAEEWARIYRRKPAAPPSRPRQQHEPERGEFSMEQFREIFSGVLPEPGAEPPKITPIEPPPGHGKTSLFD